MQKLHANKKKIITPLSSHLAALKIKQAELTSQIEDTENAPGACNLVISAMKRQRVHLVDEITAIAMQLIRVDLHFTHINNPNLNPSADFLLY